MRVLSLMLSAVLASSLGCALCASPYDYTYSAYGGLRQRHDMCHGRVGSIIDPAPAAGMERLVPVDEVRRSREAAESEPLPPPPDEPSTPPPTRPGDGSDSPLPDAELPELDLPVTIPAQ